MLDDTIAKEDCNLAFYLASHNTKIDGAWTDKDISFICNSIERMIKEIVDERMKDFKKELLEIIYEPEEEAESCNQD